jgi:hypothetical protein
VGDGLRLQAAQPSGRKALSQTRYGLNKRILTSWTHQYLSGAQQGALSARVVWQASLNGWWRDGSAAAPS